jgi:hypothetical protein
MGIFAFTAVMQKKLPQARRNTVPSAAPRPTPASPSANPRTWKQWHHSAAEKGSTFMLLLDVISSLLSRDY